MYWRAINTWQDFVILQAKLDRRSKGDAFELLCKYYFQFHPKNEHIYRDHVWLLKEVPERVKQELGLGEDVGFDLLIEDKLIVELKSVEKMLGVHEAQLLTYMKLSGISLGLLINFNSKILKDGLKRFVL